MFNELKELMADGDKVTITVMRVADDLTVSVLPNNKASVKQMNLTASAQELDEKFIETIQQPLAVSKEMSTNIEEFEQAAKDEAKSKKPKAATTTKKSATEIKIEKVSDWEKKATAATKVKHDLTTKEGTIKAKDELNKMVKLDGFTAKDLDTKQSELLSNIERAIVTCDETIKSFEKQASLF